MVKSPHLKDYVTFHQFGAVSRSALENFLDVNARDIFRQADIASQLGIGGGAEVKTGCGKTLVGSLLCVF